MDLIADTNYLVSLYRGEGWATAYAAGNSSSTLGLPRIVLGEFWQKVPLLGHFPTIPDNA